MRSIDKETNMNKFFKLCNSIHKLRADLEEIEYILDSIVRDSDNACSDQESSDNPEFTRNQTPCFTMDIDNPDSPVNKPIFDFVSSNEGESRADVKIVPESISIDDKTTVDESVKKRRKSSPKRPIDIGKLWALHDAGWSVPKIADDLRCSVSSVYRILRNPSSRKDTDSSSLDDLFY